MEVFKCDIRYAKTDRIFYFFDDPNSIFKIISIEYIKKGKYYEFTNGKSYKYILYDINRKTNVEIILNRNSNFCGKEIIQL